MNFRLLAFALLAWVFSAGSPAYSKPKEDIAVPRRTASAACPKPSPHYKRVRGVCRPSCGVLLKGRVGFMRKSCPKGSKYAGFTWEQAQHKSKCCYVAGSRSSQPAPDPTTGGDAACDMPPLHHINLHIRGGNGNRVLADATPIVCSTGSGRYARYCQETMKDPKRGCCPAKPEGHPYRVACELVLLGTDPTDRIAGPRWYFTGDGGVEKRGDNPFLAYVYGKGKVKVCSNKVNKCTEKTVP